MPAPSTSRVMACRQHRDGAKPRMSRKNAAARPPSQRQQRVAELVRQTMAELLARGDIHDEVLASHVVTVSAVTVSPDLKLATLYVLPLGGQDVQPVIRALESHRRYIRGEIAHRINLKFAPDIRFRPDESFAAGARIDAILDSPQVRRDTRPATAKREE